jgi:hypothetical protein
MRDNHGGLPEIIDAYERDGQYFGCVTLTIGAHSKTYEFGIDQMSYTAIKKILNLRPFEHMPGVKYRYFFSPKAGRRAPYSSKTFCSIRIEQEKKRKEFEIDAPETVIANLMWFVEVKDFNELSYLHEIT